MSLFERPEKLSDIIRAMNEWRPNWAPKAEPMDPAKWNEPPHPTPTELALIAAQLMGNSPVSMSAALMEAYAIWLAAKDFLEQRKGKSE